MLSCKQTKYCQIVNVNLLCSGRLCDNNVGLILARMILQTHCLARKAVKYIKHASKVFASRDISVLQKAAVPKQLGRQNTFHIFSTFVWFQMTLPGFIIPFGSSEFFNVCITCNPAEPNSSRSRCRLPIPTPCSPVHVPPIDKARL